MLSEFSELGESVIYSDYWKAYDDLVDYGVKCSKNEFVNGENYINGIENFLADYVL